MTDTSERARSAEAIHRDTQALFREFKQTGDPKLREELVLLHQNLVRFLAKKFANRGEPLDDLIVNANLLLGLVHLPKGHTFVDQGLGHLVPEREVRGFPKPANYVIVNSDLLLGLAHLPKRHTLVE